jgi:hypothetical protein
VRGAAVAAAVSLEAPLPRSLGSAPPASFAPPGGYGISVATTSKTGVGGKAAGAWKLSCWRWDECRSGGPGAPLGVASGKIHLITGGGRGGGQLCARPGSGD